MDDIYIREEPAAGSTKTQGLKTKKKKNKTHCSTNTRKKNGKTEYQLQPHALIRPHNNVCAERLDWLLSFAAIFLVRDPTPQAPLERNATPATNNSAELSQTPPAITVNIAMIVADRSMPPFLVDKDP